MIEGVFSWLLRWAEVIGGLGSLALTFLLVILYRQQKNILSRTFSASNRAIIEIDSAFLSGENFTLLLSNVGNGPGLNPELVIAGIYTDASGKVYEGVVKNRLSLVDRGASNTTGSIRPGEQEIKFIGSFSIPTLFGNHRSEFFAVIRNLKEKDIHVARIHTWVRYSDLTEESHLQYVRGWEFNPRVDLYLEEEEVSEYLDLTAQMLFGKPTLDAESLDLELKDAVTGLERTVK
jgi:hypothetical protein